MRLSVAAVLTLVVAARASTAGAQETIYVIRHAHKASEDRDAPLSDKGLRQADDLAAKLKDKGITVIYRSQFQRTLQTAEPLAKALGLRPVVVPYDDDRKRSRDVESLTWLLTGDRDHPRKGAALVVGYNDEIAQLLSRMSGQQVAPPEGFGDLFTLTRTDGRWTLGPKERYTAKDPENE